jgi:hypothetical protein
VHPREVKDGSNRSNQVILRNCLIKTKRIEKLTLIVIEPPRSSIASTAIRIRATESLFSGIANADFAAARHNICLTLTN